MFFLRDIIIPLTLHWPFKCISSIWISFLFSRCHSIYPLIWWHILFGAAASCVPPPAFYTCSCWGHRCCSLSDIENRICTGHHPLQWVQSSFIANVKKHCDTVKASIDRGWKNGPCISILLYSFCHLYLCMSLCVNKGLLFFIPCQLSYSLE